MPCVPFVPAHVAISLFCVGCAGCASFWNSPGMFFVPIVPFVRTSHFAPFLSLTWGFLDSSRTCNCPK